MRSIILVIAILVNLHSIDINTLIADFIQDINTDGVSIQYEGILYASADSKAYWRYNKPIAQEIYINKDKITTYEPSSKQAIISNNQNINFIAILKDVKQNGNHLTSTSNGITFDITLKDNKPYKIQYTDELENQISITLYNVSINEKIDDRIFEAKLPKDTEIIIDNK